MERDKIIVLQDSTQFYILVETNEKGQLELVSAHKEPTVLLNAKSKLDYEKKNPKILHVIISKYGFGIIRGSTKEELNGK